MLPHFSRKDPHGFFAFPVTDAIAPGYSTIIKHPMDFSTMKDKIINNEYNTVTEFKVRIQFYNTVISVNKAASYTSRFPSFRRTLS